MKKINDIKIETFQPENFSDFRIEVTETETEYTAFIYHIDYGIKEMMFGCKKKTTSYKTFLNMASENFSDYVIGYIEEYI